jgi:hypothetical protein
VKNSLEPLSLILAWGFPLDRAQIIHAFVGGSALRGVKLGGTNDTDVYEIYVEKPWVALVIASGNSHAKSHIMVAAV